VYLVTCNNKCLSVDVVERLYVRMYVDMDSDGLMVLLEGCEPRSTALERDIYRWYLQPVYLE
jgi:hypothetical protein